MTTSISGLTIRKLLGRKEWSPPRPFGPDGWIFERPGPDPARIIVTVSPDEHDPIEWIHASIAKPTMPTYEDLQLVHFAVFQGRFAYQVFAPESQHVNIHETALHLWGRLDGAPCLPEFGRFGTI
jgi:hypothetical protein